MKTRQLGRRGHGKSPRCVSVVLSTSLKCEVAVPALYDNAMVNVEIDDIDDL
jgi:hypothetical protein